MSIEQYIAQHFEHTPRAEYVGRVNRVDSFRLYANLPKARLGDAVVIHRQSDRIVEGLVGRITEDGCEIFCEQSCDGIACGDEVLKVRDFYQTLNTQMCGSYVNGYGEIQQRFSEPDPHLNALPTISRGRLSQSKQADVVVPFEPWVTGIPVIDTFTSLAYGQGISLIAPPGVGKTTLVEQLVRSGSLDIRIVVLIGERRREITAFRESIASSPYAGRTILVASPSSASFFEKDRAAQLGFTLAEYFRDFGFRVLLVLDSLSRLARAWRDTALFQGELPARSGYPVSVFERIPNLLERVGCVASGGSITAVYTLLANDDVIEDPLLEETRGVSDGHIYLSKRLAQSGIYPAIDIEKSLSRLQDVVIDSSARALLSRLRAWVSEYVQNQDIIRLTEENNENSRIARQRFEQLYCAFQHIPRYHTLPTLYSYLEKRLAQLQAL